jgi:hypothetical protein
MEVVLGKVNLGFYLEKYNFRTIKIFKIKTVEKNHVKTKKAEIRK